MRAEQPPPLPWDRPALIPLGFQAGGALDAHALYVDRRADRQLFDALRQGKPCYVLAPRQIGKTSLLLRTKDKLLEQGWQCVSLDMQIFATDSESGFYGGVIDRLARELDLEWDGTEFRQRHLLSPPSYQWVSFLLDHLLPARRKHLAIFIDEVDNLTQRPFGASEFLYGLRTAIERSAQMPLPQNGTRLLLTVCLAGVAPHMDLARDARRSLIEISQGIELSDFSQDEASQLFPALTALSIYGTPQSWLDAILEWTDGHPYLTQRLCADLANDPPLQPGDYKSNSSIERELIRKEITDRVKRLFLYQREDYLESIKNQIEEQRNNSNYRELISLYRRIYIHGTGREIDYNAHDVIQQNLLLRGLVKRKLKDRPIGTTTTNNLVVRNRIIAEKFGVIWMRQQEHPALATFSDKMIHFFQEKENSKYALSYREIQTLTEEASRYDLSLGREYTNFIARSEKKRRQKGLTIVIVSALFLALATVGTGFTIQHNLAGKQLRREKDDLELQVAELSSKVSELEEQITAMGTGIDSLVLQENTLLDQIEIQKQRILSLDGQLTAISDLLRSVKKNKRGALLTLQRQLSDAVASLKQRNQMLSRHIGDLQQRVKKQTVTQKKRIAQLGAEDQRTEEALRKLDSKWNNANAQGAPDLLRNLAKWLERSDGSRGQLSAETARAVRLTLERDGKASVLPFEERTGVQAERMAICPQATEQGGLFVSFDEKGLWLWTASALMSAGDKPIRLSDRADLRHAAALGACSRGVAASAGGQVVVWEGRSARAGKSLPNPVRLLALAPSTDGELPDGLPLLSSSVERQLVRSLLRDVELNSPGPPLLHDYAVTLAVLSPDGSAVVSATDRRLLLWDFVSGRRAPTDGEQAAAITALTLSPHDDGTTVVSGSSQGEIKKWTRSRDGLLPRRAMQVHQGSVQDVVVAQRGRDVISAGSDGYIVWTDPRDGQRLFRISPFGGSSPTPRRLGVSLDGRRLIVGFDDRVRLYHIDDLDFVRAYCNTLKVGSDVKRDEFAAACGKLPAG